MHRSDKRYRRALPLSESLLCLLLFLSPLIYAEDTVTTIHIVTPSWHGQTNKDGTGLFFEILRRVYEPAGIMMTYQFVPWKRAEMMIETRQADARLAIIRTSKDQLMPRYPLYVDYTVVVFKKERGRDWQGIPTLDGKRTVWMRGYDLHTLPELNTVTMKWEEVNNHEQAWKMIENDRVDFYIDALIDVEPYITEHQIDMTPYQLEILYDRNAYIHFANTQKSEKLIEIYDQRIVELFRSGELEQIFTKWNVKFEPFQVGDK